MKVVESRLLTGLVDPVLATGVKSTRYRLVVDSFAGRPSEYGGRRVDLGDPESILGNPDVTVDDVAVFVAAQAAVDETVAGEPGGSPLRGIVDNLFPDCVVVADPSGKAAVFPHGAKGRLDYVAGITLGEGRSLWLECWSREALVWERVGEPARLVLWDVLTCNKPFCDAVVEVSRGVGGLSEVGCTWSGGFWSRNESHRLWRAAEYGRLGFSGMVDAIIRGADNG